MNNTCQNIEFKRFISNEHFSKELALEYLSKSSENLDEAMQLVFEGKHPYAWRAAYMLAYYFKSHPNLVIQYIHDIIDQVKIAKPDGLQRELLRMIMIAGFNEAYAGKVVDLCFSLWESVKKQASVRMIALKILLQYSEHYPELKPELIVLTEIHGFDNQRGAKHSTQKIRESLINDCKKLKLNINY
jgi:hypothetical protein